MTRTWRYRAPRCEGWKSESPSLPWRTSVPTGTGWKSVLREIGGHHRGAAAGFPGGDLPDHPLQRVESGRAVRGEHVPGAPGRRETGATGSAWTSARPRSISPCWTSSPARCWRGRRFSTGRWRSAGTSSPARRASTTSADRSGDAALQTIEEGARQILAETGVSAPAGRENRRGRQPDHDPHPERDRSLPAHPRSLHPGDLAVGAKRARVLWLELPGAGIRGDPSPGLRVRGGGYHRHDRVPRPRAGEEDLALHRHRHQRGDGPRPSRRAGHHLHGRRPRLRGRADLLRHARASRGGARRGHFAGRRSFS